MSNEELIKKIDEDCALAAQEDNDSMFIAAILSILVTIALIGVIAYGTYNTLPIYLKI